MRITQVTKVGALAALVAAGPGTAAAQVSLTAPRNVVRIDFAGFDGSGFSPTPAAGQLDSDDWSVVGMSFATFAFGDTRTADDFARRSSPGGVTTGGVYAFAAAGAGDPALGVQPGGTDFTPGSLILRLRNDTGAVLDELRVSYRVWVYNDQDRASSFNLQRSTDLVTFTNVPGAAHTTAEAQDLAVRWKSTDISVSITGLAVPTGAFLYLAWAGDDVSGTGSRDEIALDDIVIQLPCTSGAQCSDADACTGTESCTGGVCVAGTPLSCDDGNTCTADSCGATTGCANVPLAMGTSCADGDACNGDERCNGAGTCAAGTAPDCDDADPCTTDACSAASGCTHVFASAGTSCSDGDACNGAELCGATGACAAGSAPDCDDSNPCTTDVCNPASGCANTPVAAGTACVDSDACNGRELCSAAGVCQSGTALDCDDGNSCTADSCDAALGCQNDAIDGCCLGDADCFDGDSCTLDSCASGACAHEAVAGCAADGGMMTVDGGSADTDAGSMGADSGPMVADAGRARPPSQPGCACTTPGGPSRTGLGWVLALLAAAVLLRRSRPRPAVRSPRQLRPTPGP